MTPGYRLLLTGLLMSLALYGVFPQSALADPGTLNYQGSLTDNNNVPVDATVNITFRLYAGSTQVWQEAHTVAVTRGYFSIELGSITPLDPALFQQALTLGIAVGADPEMTPRKALSAAAYSFRATDAARVNGYVPDTQTQLYRVTNTFCGLPSVTYLIGPTFSATCLTRSWLQTFASGSYFYDCVGNQTSSQTSYACNNTPLGVLVRPTP